MRLQSQFRDAAMYRCLVLGCLTCIWVLMQSAIASGQSLSVFDHQTGTIPPEGVIRYGSIEAAWVRSPLDGERLFQVAAPTVTDRSNLSAQDFPVEIRAQSVEALLKIEVDRFHRNVLNRLARQFRLWDAGWTVPRSAEVITATLNNRPVVQIKSSDRSRPLTIITITQIDIDFYSETPEVLSEEWRTIVQGEIDKVEELASLATARRGLQWSLAIVVGLIVVLSLFSLLSWLIRRQFRVLQTHREGAIAAAVTPVTPLAAAAHAPSHHAALPIEPAHKMDAVRPSQPRSPSRRLGLLAQRARFLEVLKNKPPLAHQLNALKFLQWLLVWLAILSVYGSLIGLTYTLPIVTAWRTTLFREPFKILLIWFAVGVALRINRALAYRRTQAHKQLPATQCNEDQRKFLRMNTIGGALEGLISVLIVLTGIIFTFSTFGLSTQSVLAWGAVLGLAISFGTQSLIKDVINGCLILLEDQFAVGDVIAIGSMSGLVEEMNLRSTRLRNPEGELITIPNGNIAEVRNLTRLWSRVDFTIEVAYDNDPDRVLTLLNNIAQELYRSPEWRDKMPDPPEVLGIEQLSHAGILVRVWIKTAPLQQWVVGREYRLRVRRAFEAHGIAIGKPQWISYNSPLDLSSARAGDSLAQKAVTRKPFSQRGFDDEI
ncbi:MAG: mechanosensitive ion channel family protein [Leptolyngbyaceae cyanobacterium]